MAEAAQRAKMQAFQAVVHRRYGGRFRRRARRCTLPGMTITVDVDLLRQHRLGLLAEADEIERSSSLDPPDVGPLTAVTAEALQRLSERAQRRAGDARELADALERWLVVADATDGDVGVGLDLLTSQVLAL